jgi:type II secretion system protein I
MNLPPKHAPKRARRGFTLAEVLVALAFMAIVIPVVLQGLRIASLAGEVSQRKALAARIAERVLNEAIVTGQFASTQSGTEQSGGYQYQWSTKSEPWNSIATVLTVNNPNGINQSVVNQNNIHELSVDVTFAAQGKNYSVHLSTLVNVSQPVTASALPPMNSVQ